MTQLAAEPFTRVDGFKEFILRMAASLRVPGHWFNKNLPPATALKPATSPLKLEIVSHCWNYSQFLLYQLSSLVNYPPQTLQVTCTVFYAEADANTVDLLNFFRCLEVPNVGWNFRALPTAQLFRRAIGRNLAAKRSRADWVWFTDCDVVFHRGALDALAAQLVGRRDMLVYPQEMLCTTLLQKDDPLIAKAKVRPAVLDVDIAEFAPLRFSRAIGPIQIVHGDVARACGYCADLAVYQKTMPRWSKCYEDRAFRWLLGTRGVPIGVPNVLFMRHAEKGRYQKNSPYSAFRTTIRRLKSKILDR